jgi:flap endonuclease-1
MGIKDLTVFLKEFAPNSISKGNLSQIKSILKTQRPHGKMRAAIDTSLFLYKYKYRSGDNFINEFLEQINRLLINNIEPVYIFDGAPPKEKKDTLKQRKERKENYLAKIKDLESQLDQLKQNTDVSDESSKSKEIETSLLEEISKIKRKTIFVTAEDNNKLLYFLDIMNIKHIKRDMEADIVCSKLSSSGLVDFVISEDMDHLTSGTAILLRDFNNKNNYVTMYNLNTTLNTLNMSHSKWIELCILFGCDYVPRIRGLGYKTSYKFLSENKECNFDTILEKIQQVKKFNLPENYIQKVNRARDIFVNDININIDEAFFINENETFENQISVVIEYLKKYTKFSDQKIKNRIKNIFGYCIDK